MPLPHFWLTIFLCLHVAFPPPPFFFTGGRRVEREKERGKRVDILCLFFFYKGTNPIVSALTSWPNLTLIIFQRPHLQTTSHSGLRLPHTFWRYTTIQSIAFCLRPPKFMPFSHAKHVYSIPTAPKSELILASTLRSNVQSLL